MEASTRKFLEFNGKVIYFLAQNGTYWVAIKPICEALQVDYERQRKNLKNDPFWDQLPSNQTVVAADGKVRKMLCLPEQFIYGWLCGLQSNSPELVTYKRKCYNLLFDYFHGSITSREKLISQRIQAELKMKTAEASIAHLPEVQQINDLRGKIFNINKSLKSLDNEIGQAQLSLFKHI